MKYFVIQAANGLFYSDNEILGYKDSIEADAQGNKSVHSRAILAPVFHAATHKQALKYETEQDAADHFKHPDLKDPAAFGGCKVATIEF